MIYFRYNTATIKSVGPFYDKTDGVTIETALTITNERITMTMDSNDGSAPTLVLDNITGATSGTSNDLNYITNNDAGLMQLEFSAANTSYLGTGKLSITDAANHCPVFHDILILPQQVYDSMILGTDLLDANASQLGGTSQTGSDVGADTAAIKAKTDNLPTDPADESLVIAATTAIYDRIGAPGGASIASDIAALPTDADVNAACDTAISDAALATAANLATVDTVVDAIKTKTDSLTFTVAGNVDANVQLVNDVVLVGDGSATPWGPA